MRSQQFIENFFSMDLTVAAEDFRLNRPILKKLNFPPLAGHSDFNHDRVIAMLAEVVENLPVPQPI